MKIPIFILSVLIVLSSNAASYFIDWDTGSDSNNGTSTGTPWKRHPYMSGWSGSYTHSAGDRFIFKGGVTWPSTALPLTITSTGSSDSVRDFYGITNGWGSGRAIFDSEYETNSATVNGSGVAGYLLFSGLEIKRLTCSANFGPGLMAFGGPVSVTISNCYIHSWRLDPAVATDDAHGGLIAAYGGDISTVLVDSEIENSSNNDRWNGVCVRLWGVIRNCLIHDNSSGVLFCNDFDMSSLYRICYPSNSFDGTYHLNGVYHQPSLFSGTNTGYIRNSKFWDVSGGANMIYPNPSSNYVNKVYNNLVYGVQSAQGPVEIDPYLKGGEVFVDNNTIICWTNNLPGVHMVVRSGYAVSNLYIRNNHVVNASSIHDALTNQTTGTFYVGTNILQTSSSALSSGYTLGNLYAPTTGSSITVDSGETLSYFSADSVSVPRPSGNAWDLGSYEFQSGPTNVLLILTEPTARGLAGTALDRVILEDKRAGWNVRIVELPRWTGTWATNDWNLLNAMKRAVDRFCTSTNDAVIVFGKLPFLQTGGHNDDGHYLRRVATDGWLGCSGLTFTDSTDWMEPALIPGMTSSDIMASNRIADGFPDNMSGTLFIPVTRIDASDMGAAPTNYVFASGYLSGQVYQPAINEGYWLRNYLTNVWEYQTRQWTVTETGFIDTQYSAWATGAAAIQSANSSITWTASTDPAGIAGGTWRFLYDGLWPEVFSPYLITSGGVATRAFWIVTYKSYEMDMWDSVRHPMRRLCPGVINRPFSLVASWCPGSVSPPYFRSRPGNVTVFDVIRSCAASNANTVDFRYNVYGWGTLKVIQPNTTKRSQATMSSLNVN